jgi:hypothetical protein
MARDQWADIAMKAQSGKTVDYEMSEGMAAQIQKLTGLRAPVQPQRLMNRLPTVEFAPGLSDSEVAAAEQTFAFRFPPDLRAFLQTALPCGQFPNWRSGDEAALRSRLDLPRKGILFDVQHNGFWLPEWGEHPEQLEQALRIASDSVGAAPKLIPIYAHRMMPDEPHLPGNPVFSVHQTDIIYYGFDLADYLRHEFHIPGREPWPETVRQSGSGTLTAFKKPVGLVVPVSQIPEHCLLG